MKQLKTSTISTSRKSTHHADTGQARTGEEGYVNRWGMVLIAALAGLVVVFGDATVKFDPTWVAPLSDQLVDRYIEQAYNDQEALQKDMDEMDRLQRQQSPQAAMQFFRTTMLKRAQKSFQQAVINAPAEELEAYYQYNLQLVAATKAKAPKVCSMMMGSGTNLQDPAIAQEIAKTAKGIQFDRFKESKLKADIIIAARENPAPLNMTPEQAVQIYEKYLVQHIIAENKIELVKRVAAGLANDIDKCNSLIIASHSVDAAPPEHRLTAMKGQILVGFVE